MHCGYVVKIDKLRPHANADRLQIATFFGCDTCVGLDVKVGDIGIYFPVDLQLSEQYASVNNLVRKKDDAGNNIGGFLDPDKRNIKAINLRGEKSDGLYMPIASLEFTGVNTELMGIGDTISVVNGIEICCKYIPRSNKPTQSSVAGGNKTRKKKAPIAPLFAEHADTEQLAYNLSAFKPGDEIEITLKMHGTSQRTGYLPTLKGYKRTLWDKLLRREGKPIYDWGYVSGTRRTVLEDFDGGYYGSNEFREAHSKLFEGKLMKGEEIYYEVVSYTSTGTPIMGACKVPKEYQKLYGTSMEFHYGIERPQSDIYVYRMTITNEDGFVVEYTPDFMRYRCEQMGVKCVPVMWKGVIPQNPGSSDDDTITAGEWIINKAEQFYDGADPIGKTHIREGVVVRIVNRPKFCAFKHKNWLFKYMTGVIKDTVNITDEDILSEL